FGIAAVMTRQSSFPGCTAQLVDGLRNRLLRQEALDALEIIRQSGEAPGQFSASTEAVEGGFWRLVFGWRCSRRFSYSLNVRQMAARNLGSSLAKAGSSREASANVTSFSPIK